jgi:MFS family permease
MPDLPQGGEPLLQDAVLADAAPPGLAHSGSFWLLMSAQITEQLGDSLNLILLLALLTVGLGHDAHRASIALFVPMLMPILFLGPVAGVFVDRWPRKNWLLLAAGGRGVIIACSALLAPWVIQGEGWALGLVTLLILLLSTLWQFYNPARSASLPEIVNRRDLDLANGMSVIVLLMMQIIGFLLGGLLGDNLPLQKALWANAGLYAICFALMLGIRFHAGEPQSFTPLSLTQVFKEQGHALAELFSRQLRLRAAVGKAVLLVAGAGLGFTVLQDYTRTLRFPGFVDAFNRVLLENGGFHVGDLTRFTLLLLTLGVGAAFGAGLLAALKDHIPQLVLIQAGLALAGLAACLMPFCQQFDTAGLAMALMGVGAILVVALTEARLQAKIPAHLRGKVLSAYFLARGMVALGGASLPGLLDKFTGSHIQPRPALQALGYVVLGTWLLTSVYEYYAHRGEKEEQP